MKIKKFYEFSKCRLPKSHDLIKIICKKHGIFSIRYDSYKRGHGCTLCSNRVPNGFWNIKDNCIKDALNYKRPVDWKKNSPTAYRIAGINKWRLECYNHMKISNKKNWNIKDNCIKDALNYNTRTEWSIKSGGAYTEAKRNKWLNECCKHMSKRVPHNKFYTIKFCIKYAKKFKTIKDFRNQNPSAYNAARRNGWLNICCKHMEEKRAYSI